MARTWVTCWVASLCVGCVDYGFGPGDFSGPEDGSAPDVFVRDAAPEDAGAEDAGPSEDGGADADVGTDADGMDADVEDGGVDAGTPDAGPAPRWVQIDVVGAHLAETLERYPLLVLLDPTRIDYAAAGAGGADVRFFAADGVTLLPHEVDVWNVGGRSAVWVRLPQLPPTGTVLLMSYGPGVTPPILPMGHQAATWARFSGVFHFEGGAVFDSVSATAALNQGAQTTTGTLGDGLGFDGAASVEIPLGLMAPTAGSACTWMRSTTAGGQAIYGAGVTGGDGYGPDLEIHLGISGGGFASFFIKSDGNDDNAGIFSNAVVDDDRWHHLCASWLFGGEARLFVDGAFVESDPHDAILWGPQMISRLGGTDGVERHFVGDLDEVRVSGSTLSDDWFETDYLATRDLGLLTFTSTGAP